MAIGDSSGRLQWPVRDGEESVMVCQKACWSIC